MPTPGTPAGHQTVAPYLLVDDVPRLLRFVTEAFSADEIWRQTTPAEGLRHVELRIGDSVVMIGARRPQLPPLCGSVHVYVADVDAAYARALAAGATALAPPADRPYGDRSGGVRDPAGNLWWLGTNLTPRP